MPPPGINNINKPITPTTLSKDKLKTQSHMNPKTKGKGKAFECTNFPPCSMVFTRYEHLARHIRKHTGERPFQCEFCNKRFSRLDNLRQHIHTVHNKQQSSLDTNNKSYPGKRNSASSNNQYVHQQVYPSQQQQEHLQQKQQQTLQQNQQMMMPYHNLSSIPMMMANQMPPQYILQRPYNPNNQLAPLPPNMDYQFNYYTHTPQFSGHPQQQQLQSHQQQQQQQQKSHIHQPTLTSASSAPVIYSNTNQQSGLPPPRNKILLERSSTIPEFRPRSNKPMPLNISNSNNSNDNLISPNNQINTYNQDSSDQNNSILSTNLVTPSTATSVSSLANISGSSNFSSNSSYSQHLQLQSQYPSHYKSPLANYGNMTSPSNGPMSNFSSPYALNFNPYLLPPAMQTGQSPIQQQHQHQQQQQQQQQNVYGYKMKMPNDIVGQSISSSPTNDTSQLLVDPSKYSNSQQLRNMGLLKPSGLSRQYIASSDNGTDIDDSEKNANDSDETIKPPHFKNAIMNDSRVNTVAHLNTPSVVLNGNSWNPISNQAASPNENKFYDSAVLTPSNGGYVQ